MHTESMTMRSDKPLVIATANGLIEIHRSPHSSDRRRLMFVLPDGVHVEVGVQNASKRSDWLDVEHDGKDVKPRHKVLESRVDEDGNLVSLGPPRPLRVVRPRLAAARSG